MATYCFSVVTDATPTSLPRLLDVFALHGFVPDQCYTAYTGIGREELSVDLHLSELNAEQARLLAKRLARIITVSRVIYSEKLQCAA